MGTGGAVSVHTPLLSYFGLSLVLAPEWLEREWIGTTGYGLPDGMGTMAGWLGMCPEWAAVIGPPLPETGETTHVKTLWKLMWILCENSTGPLFEFFFDKFGRFWSVTLDMTSSHKNNWIEKSITCTWMNHILRYWSCVTSFNDISLVLSDRYPGKLQTQIWEIREGE